MNKIESFKRDHNNITPGIYLQECKHNILIYDLRFVAPNTEYIEIEAIHTIEHLFATWLKNSIYKQDIISFCPGGCQTMFYLEVYSKNKNADIKSIILNCIDWALLQDTIPGATKEECGNYKSHSLELAKKWLERYKRELTNG